MTSLLDWIPSLSWVKQKKHKKYIFVLPTSLGSAIVLYKHCQNALSIYLSISLFLMLPVNIVQTLPTTTERGESN
jgi:hypothetical protein